MGTTLKLVLAKFFKEDALSYMAEHPEDFEKLVQIALSDEPHACWRAAWLVKNCMTKNDERVQKYLDEMVNVLAGKEDGHQRELLKVLMEMELGEEHESYLFDHCISLWESLKKTPSVRCIAFKMMDQIAKKYPELSGEVISLTQPQYINSLSPGIKRSIVKMVNKLKR